MGKKSLLNTHNMSLKYLFDQPYLNSRKCRWLDFVSEYHFELKHIKGKENKFLWTTKFKEIFQNLKQLLTTAPILRIVDHNGDFIVCTDVRKEGLGGFLMKNDYAIYYES